MTMFRKSLLGAVAALTVFDAPLVMAQIDEIVVTARKRMESQQDVPIAVSTISAEDFEARNIGNIARIDEVAPNVTIDATAPISGSSNATSIFIRGVGQTDFVPTSDPGVGVYLDGVYIARSMGGLLDLKDVGQVEVLRGPQGTLFGKNTIGGAINVTTIKPTTDEASGEVQVSVGMFNREDFSAAVNIPVSENLAVRLSGKRTKSDGYGRRADGASMGGEDRYTVRGSLRYTPTDRLTIDASVDYSDADEDSPVSTTVSGSRTYAAGARDTVFAGVLYNRLIGAAGPTDVSTATIATPIGAVNLGLPPLTIPALPADTQAYNKELIETGNLYHSNGTGPTGSQYDILGFNTTISYDVSDSMTLKSITAFRDQDMAFGRDPDGSPLELVHTQNTGGSEQLSQEFQLAGEYGAMDWILGVYYLDEEGSDGVTVPFAHETFKQLGAQGQLCTFPPLLAAGVPNGQLPCNLLNLFRIDHNDAGTKFANESRAVFGEVTYRVSPQLSVTGGVRWTEDDKSIDITDMLGGGAPLIANPIAEDTFDEITPRVIVDYSPREDLLTYASYSQGFKSGGYNPRYGVPLAAPTSFEPETVDSFELGVKADFWERRGRVNAAVFMSEYTDMQVVVFDAGIPRTMNAAEGEISGLEIEATFQPDAHWLVQASLGLIDAEYTKLDTMVAGSTGVPIVNPLSSDYLFVNTPETVAAFGVQYTHTAGAWDITYRGDASFRSEWANDAVNTPELIQDDLTLISGRVTLSSNDAPWSLALYGTNLTDEEYITSGVADEPGFGLVELNAGRPRELGLTLNVDF